jgi:type IV secretion system protein VirB9
MTLDRIAALALLPLVFAGPAARAQDDSRLVSHEFSTGEIVKIRGKLGVQATIAFDEAEQIENVAVGDSQKWQITPNKRANLLFVKPLEATAATNMTVVTDKRTYLFDLVASPRERPVYMFRFTYDGKRKPLPAPPAETAPAIVRTEAVAATPEPRQAASAAFQEAFAPPVVSAPDEPVAPGSFLSFAWQATGDASLLPRRVWDDGKVTYLAWISGQTVPEIFLADAAGEETAAPFRLAESTAIVQAVPSRLVLRHQDISATLSNIRVKGEAEPASTAPSDSPPAAAEEPAVPADTALPDVQVS